MRATLPPIPRARDERVNWVSSIPFLLVHVLCLAVIFTGVTWTAFWLFVVMYFGRAFFVTAAYHRYFSHKAFRTSRAMQFVFALLGASAVQRGPLWWASQHRHHHVYADGEQKGKPVAPASLPLGGPPANAYAQDAASGTVRSKYQPAGTTSLEGLTWPDTYYVTPEEDETVILRRIVDRYDAEVRRLGIPAAAAARGESVYTATIVASLIQGEAGVERDRPLISAVIANRLAAGMPLQIDATLLYARGDRGPLTDADFARPGPYNTYRVNGLPPTPIMTVAAPSLQAAVAPAAVPYRYYVLTDRDGSHRFAVTYEEHLANVADARRRGIL